MAPSTQSVRGAFKLSGLSPDQLEAIDKELHPMVTVPKRPRKTTDPKGQKARTK
jgi:hypothetical protein